MEFWWAKNAWFTLNLDILREPKLHVFNSLCFKFSSRCFSKAFLSIENHLIEQNWFLWKTNFSVSYNSIRNTTGQNWGKELLAPTHFNISTHFFSKNSLELIHQSLIPWCNTVKRLLDWKTSNFLSSNWILNGQKLRKVHFIKLFCLFWISELSKFSVTVFFRRGQYPLEIFRVQSGFIC